jgi:hypothetical protein
MKPSTFTCGALMSALMAGLGCGTEVEVTDAGTGGAGMGPPPVEPWAHAYGDSCRQEGHALALGPDEDIIGLGWAACTIDFGTGEVGVVDERSAVVARFDRSGHASWATAITGEWLTAASMTTGNEVVFTGYFDGALESELGTYQSAAGGPDVYMTRLDPRSGVPIALDALGGTLDDTQEIVAGPFLAAGSQPIVAIGYEPAFDLDGATLTSTGYTDGVLAEVGPATSVSWSSQFGGTYLDRALALARTSDEGVVAVGQFDFDLTWAGGTIEGSSVEDIFVLRFDSLGSPLWGKAFGGDDSQLAYDLSTNAADEMLISGSFRGELDFGTGEMTSGSERAAFIAKLRPDGSGLWSATNAGDGSVFYAKAAFAPDGSVVACGVFRGTIDFGLGSLTSSGSGDTDDIFVAAFNADGTIRRAERFGDAEQDDCWDVVVDAAGQTIITGTFAGTIDFGTGPLTAKDLPDMFLAKLSF